MIKEENRRELLINNLAYLVSSSKSMLIVFELTQESFDISIVKIICKLFKDIFEGTMKVLGVDLSVFELALF